MGVFALQIHRISLRTRSAGEWRQIPKAPGRIDSIVRSRYGVESAARANWFESAWPGQRMDLVGQHPEIG